MCFDKLKMEHYVLIAVVAVVIVLLFMYGRKEGYSPIQGFPFVPPKYWDPIETTYWSPWFYTENAYDTVVPKVSMSDPGKFHKGTEGFGDVNSMNLTTIVVIALLAAIMYHLFTHEKR